MLISLFPKAKDMQISFVRSLSIQVIAVNGSLFINVVTAIIITPYCFYSYSGGLIKLENKNNEVRRFRRPSSVYWAMQHTRV